MVSATWCQATVRNTDGPRTGPMAKWKPSCTCGRNTTTSWKWARGTLRFTRRCPRGSFSWQESSASRKRSRWKSPICLFSTGKCKTPVQSRGSSCCMTNPPPPPPPIFFVFVLHFLCFNRRLKATVGEGSEAPDWPYYKAIEKILSKPLENGRVNSLEFQASAAGPSTSSQSTDNLVPQSDEGLMGFLPEYTGSSDEMEIKQELDSLSSDSEHTQGSR